jgi:Tol biopolymer transport system component/DNA-binding winged helix-turn-helix (wHTH) protein
MPDHVRNDHVICFASFELDLQVGELRKNGLKLKLSGQPMQVLSILVGQAGQVVTREELQKQLWPDTFVDVDHNLNTAINKIREVLGDTAESSRFVETLPRRGYRFIAPVNGARVGARADKIAHAATTTASRNWRLPAALVLGACVLLAGAGWLVYQRRKTSVAAAPVQRSLTRLTFDDGLQTGATWSPDGRFIAFSSNRGGKMDIWMQQISGGNPVQITKGLSQSWQPDWSPDGKLITYRSEEGEGGLYIVPALGGAGLQRKVAPFGYFPRWSPDSTRILFQASQLPSYNRSYVVTLDGSPPVEVLTESLAQHFLISASWHPDGKRISSWLEPTGVSAGPPIPNFWTGAPDGGTAIESRVPEELLKEIQAVAAEPGIAEWRLDFKFCWAPSAKAIYFERTFRGARNIWRMNVNAGTLQATTVERLTTSPGLDAELSVSPDGKKLAFTSESQQVRAWSFPFDATRGRVTGPGQPVTSAGLEAWQVDLSRDAQKLTINGNRGGQWGTFEELLSNAREEPLAADAAIYDRDLPLWSPDGTRLAYVRTNRASGEAKIVEWYSQTRNEEVIATWNSALGGVFDWSPDGISLLISRINDATGRVEICKIPLSARPNGETASQKIISSTQYDLWQSRASADGRWIAFEAVKRQPQQSESAIFVVAATGGPWIRITDGKRWDDKPRWSPDGKTIYYLSDRKGYFNLWGTHFDSASGKPQGEPFPVTWFESPVLMIPRHIPTVEISLTENRLVVPMAQVSGNIWVLDNVDR